MPGRLGPGRNLALHKPEGDGSREGGSTERFVFTREPSQLVAPGTGWLCQVRAFAGEELVLKLAPLITEVMDFGFCLELTRLAGGEWSLKRRPWMILRVPLSLSVVPFSFCPPRSSSHAR